MSGGIKRRNLDNSLIQWIMAESGFGPGIGQIQYVAPATSSTSQFRAQLEAMGVDSGDISTSIATALSKTADYRNDVILIAPGTYVESLTDDLINRILLGTGTRSNVIIAPTVSNAYAGAVTDSIIKGITFQEPSSAGGTAAFSASSLRGSLIEYCKFTGKTGNVASVGLRIGAEVSAASEAMFQSTITRCVFDASGGRTKEWAYALNFGPSGATTDSDTRVFSYSEISYNQIWSEEVGIRLNHDAANGGGIIKNNVLGSRQNSGGAGIGIGHEGDSTDLLTKVIDNRINCVTDGISGFTTGNVQGNIVSLDGATPAAETA